MTSANPSYSNLFDGGNISPGQNISPDSSSKKVMVCAVIVLIVVLIFVAILHMNARWLWISSSTSTMNPTRPWLGRRRLHQRRFRFVMSEPNQGTLEAAGLSKAVVDLLPTFVYISGNLKEGLECAVCLCEFEEQEVGRTLPKCGHSFHTACIDIWFIGNSTCPLCRVEVDKDKEQYIANQQDFPASVALSSGTQLEVNPNLQAPDCAILLNSNGRLALASDHSAGAAAGASSAPSPKLSSAIILSPRTICLKVSHSASSPGRSFQSCEEDFVREAAAAYWPPEKMADPSIQRDLKQSQVLQSERLHSFTKSQESSTRLRSKKAPHVVIEVPRDSAGSLTSHINSKTANPLPSPGDCKSPRLSHLKSVRWLLLKDRRAFTPTGSSYVTEIRSGQIAQFCSQTLGSPSTCGQTHPKHHRSLPSSPSI